MLAQNTKSHKKMMSILILTILVIIQIKSQSVFQQISESIAQFLSDPFSLSKQQLKILSYSKYQIQKGIIILNSTSIASALTQFEKILILYYAPWCQHCKQMIPNYQLANKQLSIQQINITLAKLDCTKNQQLCKQFQIKGYPTIKAYQNNNFIVNYQGTKNPHKIINFSKKMFTSVQTIDHQYYKKLITFQTVSIVAHVEDFDDPIINKIIDISKEDLCNNYYVLLQQDQKLKGKLQIIRPFDKKNLKYFKTDQMPIKEWIFIYDKPIISPLNQKMNDQVYYKNHYAIVFLNHKNIYTLEQIFNQTAQVFFKQAPGQILFVLSKPKDHLYQMLISSFKIDPNQYPFLFIDGLNRKKSVLYFNNIDQICKERLLYQIQRWLNQGQIRQKGFKKKTNLYSKYYIQNLSNKQNSVIPFIEYDWKQQITNQYSNFNPKDVTNQAINKNSNLFQKDQNDITEL